MVMCSKILVIFKRVFIILHVFIWKVLRNNNKNKSCEKNCDTIFRFQRKEKQAFAITVNQEEKGCARFGIPCITLSSWNSSLWLTKRACTHSEKLHPDDVLRTSPKDVLYTSQYGRLCNAKGRPLPTSWGRLLYTSRGHTHMV